MMKEEDKQDKLPKFATIKKQGPANPIPEKAQFEWDETVHTREQAVAWHLKWTPWFTPDMITAMVDYAYKNQLITDATKANIANEVIHIKQKPT